MTLVSASASRRPVQDVLVVDNEPFDLDDYSTWLREAGFRVRPATSVDQALEMVKHHRFDLVVTDIRMQHSKHFGVRQDAGGHLSGLTLARSIRAKFPETAILGVSAVDHSCVLEWFQREQNAGFLEKSQARSPRKFLREVRRVLGLPADTRIFIVHGHDHDTVRDLKLFLHQTLKLAKPIVLMDQPCRGRTIIEKFEECGADADLVFVLFTPDDIGYPSAHPEHKTVRCRQNVVFELGYFMGMMRRRSGRVVLLETAPVEVFSDLAGVARIDIRRGILAARASIQREIESVI